MIRQRGPFSSAPSKASPQTLCQKCLKRGHYSYECKSSTQERPYASRPSRTQQLTNPKLLPKLASDVPNDLLRKKGVADEELAKKEAERGRKRKLEDDDYGNGAGKRSRSISSYSSVSTISTNRSRSMSPDIRGGGQTGQSQLMSGLEMSGKRRRSPGSSMSYTSEPEYSQKRTYGSKHRTNRRDSPTPAGYHRNSKPLRERNGNQEQNPRQRRRTSRSYSFSSSTSYSNMPDEEQAGKRRRRASKSPEDRGRERDSDGPRRSSRRTYSPSESRDRSEVTRHRKSMTPGHPSSRLDSTTTNPNPSSSAYGGGGAGGTGRRRSSYNDDNDEGDNDRYGGSSRGSWRERERDHRNFYTNNNSNSKENSRGAPDRPSRPAQQRKERSLSPFSKRLALTQAMNVGR